MDGILAKEPVHESAFRNGVRKLQHVLIFASIDGCFELQESLRLGEVNLLLVQFFRSPSNKSNSSAPLHETLLVVVVVGGDHETVVVRHLVNNGGHGDRGRGHKLGWAKGPAKHKTLDLL